MEEDKGISSGVSSEPASDSWVSGEQRNGNGLEDKDELGSKRLKVGDLDPDAKSDGNIGIVQQPDHSSEVTGLPDAQGLGTEVIAKEHLAKDRKPFTVLETTSIYLPETDDNICVANSANQSLLKDHNVKGDTSVSKISSHLKPKEISLPIARPQQDPSSEKVVPSSAADSKGESDSMRKWMEMKRNGFQSLAPPPSTPVLVPAKKKPKAVKQRDPSLKKKNEITRREQPKVDRFSVLGPPSGLLNNLNPAIIRHVRTKPQVLSILRALVGNASDNATVGESQANMNVKESDKEDKGLTVKLPSPVVLDSVNSITDPQKAMSVAVQAATVASQWLEFLDQDLSWRLTAVQKCRNRIRSILTTELPLLAKSRDSCSNKESTLQLMNKDTSGDDSSEKTETNEMKWSTRFKQMNKALDIEERDFKRSLNQVKEMLSRCNDGLCQIEEYSRSKSSDSSVGKEENQEASLAVRAAAASIFSTFSFLQSMMKPPPSS